MKLLEQIESGLKPGPRRVMLYGVQGVGKSTWASMAESPVFIQTEDGLGGIDCAKFPLAKTFDDVMAAIGELYSGKHSFKTVVIDSLDWLEKFVIASLRSGNNLLLKKIRYRVPRMSMGRPSIVKSNSPTGSRPGMMFWSFTIPLTIRLVDVPIRVTQPPRIAA